MRIEKAHLRDLKEILALQYLAYQSEAALLNDYTIQPLTQTLEEVEEEFRNGIVLKAVDDAERIIGSVRCRAKGDTCYIAKLFVHPACQKQGVGTRVLHEIESVFPAHRYELFTSDKSLKNIRFYEGNGYRRITEKAYSPGLTMVYMEK
ncbi:MAG: GNAT family N-acetyltransferase [Clostridiales bacterium]|nr:GNAT family N-acetyltransferase [Clostridiales bacterium]